MATNEPGAASIALDDPCEPRRDAAVPPPHDGDSTFPREPEATPDEAVLQQLAQDMFPEGQGKPSTKAKLASVVPMTNALFVNAKEAVSKFFQSRGYDPKRPHYTKEKLGYALDQYEAIAFVTTRAMGYPLLAPEGEEARTLAKRCPVCLRGATTGCYDGCGLPGTYAAQCMFRFDASGEPKDRRFVSSDDGMGTWSRADGEDWDVPGNPYLERLSRVK